MIMGEDTRASRDTGFIPDESLRIHKHLQMTKATFHSESYAALTKGGKPRFSVEPMVYLSGVGLEIVDPMASGNEFMIAFMNYVKLKELMGYEHTGKTGEEIGQTLKNLWGVKEL